MRQINKNNMLETGKLYIVSGVPGSGKSSFLKSLNLPKGFVVSSDEIRASIAGETISCDDYGSYISLNQSTNNLTFQIVENTINWRLKEKLTTFLDATNLTDEARTKYVKMANKLNIETEILIVGAELTINEIKDRNSKREKRVPEHVIDRFYNEFERESKFKYRNINLNEDYELVLKNRIPEDIELFIVGDVHGMYNELEKLINKEGFFIEEDCIFHKDPNKKLLFIGDIVDRGYKSIEILKLVKNSVEHQGHYMVLGNHENKIINMWNNLQNGERIPLFDASEAVSRTFIELQSLNKKEQESYIKFLEKQEFYYVQNDKLIVHANIINGNPFTLTKAEAIYGEKDKKSDFKYEQLYNEGVNKFKLIRGHIPILEKEELESEPTLWKEKLNHVISLEERAVNLGNLCMYDVRKDIVLREKSQFNYTRNLEVYDGRRLIYNFEKLKNFPIEKFNIKGESQGFKNTELISYRHNHNDTLRIYKYGKEVFYKNLWHVNPLLTKARGLVLNAHGDIVQHPFEKVFNYRENGSGLDIPNERVVIAAEKENGFLGCITQYNGELLITTTGSFDSDFTNYIKDFIMNKNFEHYDPDLYGNLMKFFNKGNNLTLMFEVIHPNDPHIIKYEKDEMGLKLIGARGKNFNDKELAETELDLIAKQIKVDRPNWFTIPYGELKDLVKDCKIEGYMVRDATSNNTLLKFKSPFYLTTKFVGRMSENNINFMYSNSEKFKSSIDEEFYELVDNIVEKIDRKEFISMEQIDRVEIVREIILGFINKENLEDGKVYFLHE